MLFMSYTVEDGFCITTLHSQEIAPGGGGGGGL